MGIELLMEQSSLLSNLVASQNIFHFSNGVNAVDRLDILAEVCTITRTIFKAYVRMNDVQRTVL